MKILLVAYSDEGGAGIAFKNFYKALYAYSNLEVDVLIWEAREIDAYRHGSFIQGSRIFNKIIRKLERLFLLNRKYLDVSYISLGCNLFSSGALSDLQDYDLIHLHWLGNGVISFKEISRVKVPIVWTLHDFWPVMGITHYPFDEKRSDQGLSLWYLKILDHFRKRQKQRFLRRVSNLNFICLSRYSEMELKNLFSAYRSSVRIGNVFDDQIFGFKNSLKKRFDFSEVSERYIILGGSNLEDNPIKGMDLVRKIFPRIRGYLQKRGIEIVVFGNREEFIFEGEGHIRCLGFIEDRVKLGDLYSKAILTLVPSRLETFGQVALESIVCGTPVVCWDNSGVADIVDHGETGYLARAFDIYDFVLGIKYIIENQDSFNDKNFIKSIERYNPKVIVDKHVDYYRKIVNAEI